MSMWGWGGPQRLQPSEAMFRGAVSLAPLAVGRQDSSSSTETSPDLLSDSGKFRVGAFEIGRDGVTEIRSEGTAAARGLSSVRATTAASVSPLLLVSNNVLGAGRFKDARAFVPSSSLSPLPECFLPVAWFSRQGVSE